MEIALLLFWLLLLGAASCTVIERVRPALVWPIAFGLSTLTLLVWLFIRGQLPLESTLLNWSASGFLPDWTWRVDQAAWSLSAWLLLVSVTVSLYAFLTVPNKNNIAPSHLVLTAVALATIWADNFIGLLAGFTLLLGSWLAILWLAGERGNAFLFRGAVLLLGLLLAWPIGSTRTALLAAALLLNIWPLPLWQSRSESATLAVFAPLLPPLVGGLLLLRLLPVAQLSPSLSLLLTVLGLVGLMRSIWLAWGRLHLPSYAVAALLLAQAHLLVLAAIWVGMAGVVAELRVLLLSGGTLALLAARPSGNRWLRLIVGSIALAALAGLPLTAAFASRASLYARWLADGRWALVLVLALLHLPLVLAGVWLLAQSFRTAIGTVQNHTATDWLREAVPLLPTMGLFSVSNVIWSAVPLLAWVALLGAAAAGIGLAHFLNDPQRVRVMLRQALGAERPLRGRVPSLKQLGVGVQMAVNDAANILDGESGVLWLLLLAVILILTG